MCCCYRRNIPVFGLRSSAILRPSVMQFNRALQRPTAGGRPLHWHEGRQIYMQGECLSTLRQLGFRNRDVVVWESGWANPPTISSIFTLYFLPATIVNFQPTFLVLNVKCPKCLVFGYLMNKNTLFLGGCGCSSHVLGRRVRHVVPARDHVKRG